MISYSEFMMLMKKYNDLKQIIENKEKPIDKDDKDIKELNTVINILSVIQQEIMGGGCQGGCCNHHH
jgi:hypothetical protein